MVNQRRFSISIRFWIVIFIACTISSPDLLGQSSQTGDEARFLEQLHAISSHKLFDYVKELASEKYAGRLTGTDEYQASANWVASLFEAWGVKPAGDNGTYFQYFDIPYTLIFPGCFICLHIPFQNTVIKKYYRYEDEFIPGSTSGAVVNASRAISNRPSRTRARRSA